MIIDADHVVARNNDGAEDRYTRHLERKRHHLEVRELHVEDRSEAILLMYREDRAHMFVRFVRRRGVRLSSDLLRCTLENHPEMLRKECVELVARWVLELCRALGLQRLALDDDAQRWLVEPADVVTLLCH